MPASLFRKLIWALLSFGVAFQAHAQDATHLTFAYFASDTNHYYRGGIEPFLTAIEEHGDGLIEIDVALSGRLGPNPADQLRLVREGVADIVFLVPGYTPDALPDHRVLELPGLFHNGREATLVHTRLAEMGMLRGYEDLVVLGAFATPPETIHSVKPLLSLDDLQGATIRVNNVMEAAALEKLGMATAEISITKIATSLSQGEIDGALVPLGAMVEFGVARIATNHFLLATSVAPLAVVMNRAKFESLPDEAKALVKQWSGLWLAEQFFASVAAFEATVLDELNDNDRRTVVQPAEADLDRAAAAFQAVREEWAALSPRNAELLAFVEAELARIRGE